MDPPQQRMLAPQYVLQIGCIGPEWEDDSCHGWRVFVDQATYRAYRWVRHTELRPILDEAVKRDRIYSLARVIEHSPAYLAQTYKMIEESGLATMPYMAILIKN